MPEVIQQARLTHEERSALESTIDGRVIEELLKTIRQHLKHHRDALASAVKTGTLTAEQAATALAELDNRTQFLRQLPLEDARPVLDSHQRAHQVLTQIHDALDT